MIAFLLGPWGKLTGAVVLLVAVWVHGYAKGHQSTAAAYREALSKANKQTTEAIGNAPVYTIDDPRVIDSLCRLAGLTDCPVRRDEAGPDAARGGAD